MRQAFRKRNVLVFNLWMDELNQTTNANILKAIKSF